jgi:glycolate oxidase
VATRIWLRVVPAPESVQTLVAFFEGTGPAGAAVSAIVEAGLVPGAIEMMDRLSIEAAEQATGAGYRLDAGAALVVELDGPREECLSGLERVMEMCSSAGSLDVRIAKTDEEREQIWRTRKAAFAAMGRIARAYYVQDGVIPRTRLGEVLEEIDRLSAEYRLRVANVFHAGDGNLHPLVCYDAEQEGEAERAEELAGLIIKACVDAGGSITGEHGVGVDKRAYMPSMFGEADLDAFQRLRCAFDPNGLANPGKVMPTPRLCGEVPGPYREHPLERAGVAERF